ncbi:MAG: hypothetical protein EBR09_08945 [Proteobacteria bacterium]|nr:hypothetical protein [Pseudomonadota bacterium]
MRSLFLGLIIAEAALVAGCRNKSSPSAVIQLGRSEATVGVNAEGNAALNLQAEVLKIFQSECYTCHGENGANSGNIGDVRNIAAMSEKGLIKIGEPAEKSKLFLRLISKTQPMPPAPKAPLSPQKLELVKTWLETKPQTRQQVTYDSVYQAIETDFNKFSAEEKVNIRYFHLVNQFNAGAPDAALEQTRKALSKMLNMLSTSDRIVKPEPIDSLRLVYRVNLAAYELDRPETLYTYMLKTVMPTMKDDELEKWLPDPAEREANKFYGARYKEIFEGKKTEAEFVKPSVHTFENGLPLAKHPILSKMAMQMRESGQKSDENTVKTYRLISATEKNNSKRCQEEANPAGIECSSPSPLLRADWFVSQVAGNMRMRLYYHASGMDDDTVTLDAALGIDDVEGSIYDNDKNFNREMIPKEQRIIRAGFNNSGVSINHRSFERIALNYVPGKPLWRAFEFKDKSLKKYRQHDLFRYAAGPVFEIGSDGEPGFECINFMTDRFTKLADGPQVRTLSLLDHGMFYPSVLPDGEEPKIVQKLKKAAAGTKEYGDLLKEFEDLYGHQDFLTWSSVDYIRKNGKLPVKKDGPYAGKTMIQCEIESSNPIAYRHETLEYLFLKRNGLQAFVNVGLKAEHLDYKIPNQRALENKEALLIPAHDRQDLMVVGAPLSCLSCHTQGYIEKEDQVSKWIAAQTSKPDNVTDDFWNRLKAKIFDFHVPFSELKQQMERDNTVFRDALSKTGVNYKDPEPIVDTYRNWAIPGMTFAQVAEDLQVTQSVLTQAIGSDKEVSDLLCELKIPNATMKRSEFEKAYRTLMCKLHKSCKTIDPKNIIPAQ